MSGFPAKIKDEQRIKIYRRVTLRDARKQYLLLSRSEQSSKIITTESPISYNFKTMHTLNDEVAYIVIIYAQHFEADDKGSNKNNNNQFREIDGLYNSPLLLRHILSPDAMIKYRDVKGKPIRSSREESFLIGLSKAQYDSLFSKVKASSESSEDEKKEEKETSKVKN